MKSQSNSVRLLAVMDSIASITPKKDSSFAMMLEAQRRGWVITVADFEDLSIRDGRAWGRLTEMRVTDRPDDWHQAGDVTAQPLDEMDVILMRKDPPFDIEYVFATHILERAEIMGAVVVNRPGGLRTANEKVFVSWFPECAPPTLVSRSIGALNDFIDEHERAVIKPLDRMAGKSVFVTGADDPNRTVLLETMTDFESRYIMAQRYLPEVVADGDARILLIDGEPLPDALVRYAPSGDHRANMSVGARTKVRPLTDAERRVCDEVGPMLHDMGLIFVGIDVIGGYLTEINVTSPTGIRELDKACGTNIAAQLLDTIAAQLRET